MKILSFKVESDGTRFIPEATLTATLKLRVPKGSKVHLHRAPKQIGYKAFVLELRADIPNPGRLILNTEEVALTYTETFPGARTSQIERVIVKDTQNHIIAEERVFWM